MFGVDKEIKQCHFPFLKRSGFIKESSHTSHKFPLCSHCGEIHFSPSSFAALCTLSPQHRDRPRWSGAAEGRHSSSQQDQMQKPGVPQAHSLQGCLKGWPLQMSTKAGVTIVAVSLCVSHFSEDFWVYLLSWVLIPGPTTAFDGKAAYLVGHPMGGTQLTPQSGFHLGSLLYPLWALPRYLCQFKILRQWNFSDLALCSLWLTSHKLIAFPQSVFLGSIREVSRLRPRLFGGD